MILQTQFDFTLPRGFVDGEGQLHRNGCMRLATALDEVEIVQDPRVQANASYLPILLLGRVIVQLGTLTAVTPEIIAALFASDMVYLQDLYLRLNGTERVVVGAICPSCSTQFQLQVAPIG